MKSNVLSILLAVILLLSAGSMFAQVAINTDGTIPDNSAMLDVKSSIKGMLVPRMTLTERNAVTSPASGLLIYQTTGTTGFYYNAGTPETPLWQMVGSNAGPWQTNGSNIYFNTGNVGIGTTSPAWKLDIVSGDARINGLRVGRGEGSISTNTAFGNLALNANTSGNYNTANGYRALYSNTEGDYNTANGHLALYTNTTGSRNTATGSQALYSNIGGTYNTACGYGSLYYNTTGDHNTALGYVALLNSTTANNNTAAGYSSLYKNTTGYSNTAVGVAALFWNTTRSNLVAIGDSALFNNGLDLFQSYHSRSNTAIGSKSLFANTIGWQNTATGTHALYSNTSGSNNVAFGHYALADNTTGTNNTAIGSDAGTTETDIWFGTFAGFNARAIVENLDNVTALGYTAKATASDQVRIGNTDVTSIGGYMGWTTLPSDSKYKTNVRENVAGLDFILGLRPVTYNLDLNKLCADMGKDRVPDENENPAQKEHAERAMKSRDAKASAVYSGFIAQEVEAAAKTIGYDFSGVDAPKNDKDFYGLRYAEFVVPLVKAVQELSAKVKALEKEIAEMKGK